ncbi:MAG: orotidine-5'-phosphate decarboxylase [Myxococcota bacterium]
MAELIVALDVPTLAEATALLDALRPDVRWFKIGLELFVAAGPDAVRAVKQRGASVFLDLKLHDIPETMARATATAATLGAELMTVHLGAGEAALRKVTAVSPRPRVVAGTLLTSLGRADALAHVVGAARHALLFGCDGVVASAVEAPALRSALGDEFTLVTPGIRRSGAAPDDHARSATPAAAVLGGATYLVVGRPIRDAVDPRAAAREILAEMRAARA